MNNYGNYNVLTFCSEYFFLLWCKKLGGNHVCVYTQEKRTYGRMKIKLWPPWSIRQPCNLQGNWPVPCCEKHWPRYLDSENLFLPEYASKIRHFKYHYVISAAGMPNILFISIKTCIHASPLPRSVLGNIKNILIHYGKSCIYKLYIFCIIKIYNVYIPYVMKGICQENRISYIFSRDSWFNEQNANNLNNIIISIK
jgi:hypothetical protein